MAVVDGRIEGGGGHFHFHFVCVDVDEWDFRWWAKSWYDT
jgi:hypothetical protein